MRDLRVDVLYPHNPAIHVSMMVAKKVHDLINMKNL